MNDVRDLFGPPLIVSRRAQRVGHPQRSVIGGWNIWIDPVTVGTGALEGKALGVSLVGVVWHAQTVVVAVVTNR